MGSLFDLFNPTFRYDLPQPAIDALHGLQRGLGSSRAEHEASTAMVRIPSTALHRNFDRASAPRGWRAREVVARSDDLLKPLQRSQAAGTLADHWASYLREATERLVLSLDVLRKRGDNSLAHEEEGCPPVLVYDDEVVMDGKDLPYPSNGMRILEASASAQRAIEYFVFRCQRKVGAMAAASGGIDALVFCGGIGENSRLVRSRICERLSWMGIEIDHARNAANARVVSSDLSRTTVMVVPTNEDLVMACAAWSVIGRTHTI